MVIALTGAAAGGASGAGSPPGAGAGSQTADAAYLYRITGKVRLLFFWAGSDDIGGARITRVGSGRDHVFSILIGTDPARAPRQMNEWGYVRENVAGDAASIFGLRTTTDGASPDEADARRAQSGGAEFGVLCSTVSSSAAATSTTTVYAPRDVTFRDFERILDVIDHGVRWTHRNTPRPAGADPGFLTAMESVMRSTAAAAHESKDVPVPPPRAYVYKQSVYDLIPRRIERVSELDIRSTPFRDVLRTEFAIRNRTSGWTTTFWVAYGTEGPLAGVPIWARYQPNWWIKMELEFDSTADAPPDPAADTRVHQRIDRLCAPPA